MGAAGCVAVAEVMKRSTRAPHGNGGASVPRLVFWETTAGCNLRCIHCRRIDVADKLAPEDLTTEESKDLVDQILTFSRPILILSGGEPLFRPDIFDIARYAVESGLRVALATNATLIDGAMARRIAESGIARVAVSLDGASQGTHDAFRALPGAFHQALEGFARLKAREMSLQINTTVARHNVHELPQIYDLALSLGADALHLFLLVPVGCGTEISDEQMVTPQEYEGVLNWLYDREQEGRLDLKATCAPHYFRIARQRRAAERRMEPPGHSDAPAVAPRGGTGHPGGLHAATKGCLAGTGVCFVSHKGEVFPCGYLPVVAGNVREEPLERIWSGASVFRQLRDSDLLQGKCGPCEFKNVCGGCRARAFGITGDYLDEEPFCLYEPKREEAGTRPANRPARRD
jgi:heme b synthase